MNVIESYNERMKQSTIDQLQFIPGIWVNGRYFWLQNGSEKVIYDEALTLNVKREQVHSKIRFSSIFAGNHSDYQKEIKLLAMHHFSSFDQDGLTFISPSDNMILHIAGKQTFLVNAAYKGTGLKEYTTIPLWNAYTDQIWSSLQKGTLKYQPMVKGPAASIFAVNITIPPKETIKMKVWAIAGTGKKELISIEKALLKNPLAFPNEK
ncbi:hypothetical protein [Bacillus sp. FJAT-29814]|uniref:hypothetical protein n=1 Tax=Bacillus sp. FJAT-29814 TaxID=1729688 RepID=UPI00082C4E81|nr:hypothetical protein [Bacillus sp. FJAT-29814]